MLDRSLLELLGESDVPLSAYDLLARLRERGRYMMAASIYRALDRLCARKLIEKVEMLSAFRVKDVPRSILMICERCRRTRPLPVPAVHESLAKSVTRVGFLARAFALEASGLCAECRRPGAGANGTPL